MENPNSYNQSVKMSQTPCPSTVEIDESLSTMVVSFRPDYSFDIIGILLLLLFGIPIFFVSNEFDDRFTWGLSMIGILGVILYFAYNRRSALCVVRKSFETVQYFRGGVFGSRINNMEHNFTTPDIVGFEIQRYVNRRWDKFQIFAVLNSGERLGLSGRDLDFAECQDFAEKICNFIDPKWRWCMND